MASVPPPVRKLLSFDSPLNPEEAARTGKLTDAIDRLEATNAEMKAERKALRSEFQRLKAIETGVNLERASVEHRWLH
jgi:hypothetical protein